MRLLCLFLTLGVLALAPPAWADDKKPEDKKPDAKTYHVPYKLTPVQHIMVRAKINGKGPFNFILDTGAPALIVATKVAEKVGAKPDKNGLTTFDKFEIEGGVAFPKCQAIITDPFQLEGMNGLGILGFELHGMIGFNVLAQHRMEIDFTRDKMVWTPVDYELPPLKGLSGKGGAAGGLEIIGTIMKMLGSFLGKQANPEVVTRGFLGIEVEAKDDVVTVKSLLPKGPAAASGLKVGDRITKFRGRSVYGLDDLYNYAMKLKPGDAVKVIVKRGDETKEIELKTGEGL